MNFETRNCQNCKTDFTIKSEDFAFYGKIQVPAPTFCPECRFQRRIMFRNERVFYRRKCDLCAKDIISVFSPEKELVVYCSPCWWSDKWDDGAIYLDYDPNKNFFEQMRDLQKKTPHMGMINNHSTLINSDYVNHAGSMKNCFLVFNADFNENVHYSTITVHLKDSMDCMMCGESELFYQNINSGSGFKLFFSEDCSECRDSYFLKGCTGCSNCFGCVNLRNQQYHIFNEPYSKEEYFKKLQEMRLDTHSGLEAAKKKVAELWLKYPRKYMHNSPVNVNCSGDYVYEAKNAKNCWQARRLEDSRYCQFITMEPVKDAYDLTEWGNGAEQVVDCLTVGEGASMIKFCDGAWQNCANVEYGMYNTGCKNTLGCINLKKKEYRILNKQYSPEEYKELREQIIKSLEENPYVDSVGRQWRYGEFLPYDLSPFAYNETHAQQLYPLSKEEILAKGWRWRDPEPLNHAVTLSADKIPDSISDVQDSILKEIIGCTK